MTELRRRMPEDLQLRGLAPKTQPCDVDAVKQLAQHSRRSPDQRSEAELRQSCLFLLHGKKVAESTCRMHLYGIKFFYKTTLPRLWPVFARVRPRHSQTRPVVLSPPDVRTLLALVEHPTAQMCLRMSYACGLRLTEGTQLSVSDSDPARMLLRVRQGQGGKDRLVPLAAAPRTPARVWAPRAPPVLALAGSHPTGAVPDGHAPEDLYSRRAPARDGQGCFHPHAAP